MTLAKGPAAEDDIALAKLTVEKINASPTKCRIVGVDVALSERRAVEVDIAVAEFRAGEAGMPSPKIVLEKSVLPLGKRNHANDMSSMPRIRRRRSRYRLRGFPQPRHSRRRAPVARGRWRLVLPKLPVILRPPWRPGLLVTRKFSKK